MDTVRSAAGVDGGVVDTGVPSGAGVPERTARSRQALTLLVWVLGTTGPVLRIADHGQPGAGAAVVITVTMLAVAAVLTAWDLLTVWVPVTAIALIVLAEVLTVADVGRAPAIVAAVGVVGAAMATGAATLGPRPARATPPAAALIGLGGVLWWVTGSGFALVVIAGAAGWASIAAFGAPRPVRSGREQLDEVSATARRVIDEHTMELIASAVAGVMAIPVFWRLSADNAVVVRGVNDFELHWERVVALGWSPFRMSVPHPTFHLLAAALEPLVSPAVSMTSICVLAVAATAGVLVRLGRSTLLGSGPLAGRWPMGFAFVALISASPAVLVSTGAAWWQRPEGYDAVGRGAGFLPLHIWGSPTITLAFPLYLALIVSALSLWDRPAASGRRALVVGLALVATLTMPAGTLGLVPALLILAILGLGIPEATAGIPNRLGPGSVARRLGKAAWVAVPGIVVCAWQAWFLATGQSPLEEATWRWSPFWMVERFDLDRPAFWLLLLVPLAGWWIGGRSFWRDRGVRWTGTAVLVAAFPALLLQETGWKATHGGLALSIFSCLALLTVFSIRFILAAWAEAREEHPDDPPTLSLGFGGLVLLACSTAGALEYLAAAGVLQQR